jgi:hypothetical protein
MVKNDMKEPDRRITAVNAADESFHTFCFSWSDADARDFPFMNCLDAAIAAPRLPRPLYTREMRTRLISQKRFQW